MNSKALEGAARRPGGVCREEVFAALFSCRYLSPLEQADALMKHRTIGPLLRGEHRAGAAPAPATTAPLDPAPAPAAPQINPSPVPQPPAPVPAPEGEREEREELAQLLDEEGRYLVEVAFARECNKTWGLARRVIRAAALLRESAPAPVPVPVPVAERPWERPGWCDAEGRCWWGRCADEIFNPEWALATYADIEEFCSDAMPSLTLPHWAIPTPQPPQCGEVA